MKYIGIPYVEHGRTVEGLDCYGLLRLYYREQMGVLLPDYDYQYRTDIMASLIEEHSTTGWTRVDKPQRGDAVTLRLFNTVSHVGVMISDTEFIHCEQDVGVVKNRINEPRWSRRIDGYHRYVHEVSVLTVPQLSSQARRNFTVSTNLLDIVNEQVDSSLHNNCYVTVCGNHVPQPYWQDTIVANGAIIAINITPLGGGRNILRTVLSIAVMAFSAGAGGAFFGHLIGGANITGVTLAIGQGISTILGMMAINALVPPSTQNLDDLSGTGQSNVYTIQGGQNRINLYGTVPKILGKHRIFPPYAAKPYTMLEGDDQYFYCLFAIGVGTYSLSDIKIGDTLLTEYDDYEIQSGTTATTLFPAQVNEESLAVAITVADGEQTRTTETDTDYVVLDISFLKGLVKFNDSGNPTGRGVHLTLAYTATGGSTWTEPYSNVAAISPSGTITGATVTGWRDITFTGGSPVEEASARIWIYSKSSFGTITYYAGAVVVTDSGNGFTSTPTATVDGVSGLTLSLTMNKGWGFIASSVDVYRKGIKITFPSRGQYDIKWGRQTADTDNTSIRDEATWTALRSVNTDEPLNINYTLTRLAMKIKATGQLNGILDTVSVVADSGSVTPADSYLDFMTYEGNGGAVALSKIDTTTIAVWNTKCIAQGYVFNAILDSSTPAEETIRAICSAGRASYDKPGNLHSVRYDEAQTVPVQMFTQANIKSFGMNIAFVEQPHALKCRFINEDNDYQQDPLTIYSDGYDSSTATLFEEFNPFGVTKSDPLWKLGRYYLARGIYQKESFIFDTDFEHLNCTKGDLIVMCHDVPEISIGAGRITAIGATSVTLDETMTLDGSTAYSIIFREDTGTHTSVTLTAGQSGDINEYELSSVPSGIKIGDLAVLYTTSEGIDYGIITSITRSNDLNATISCVSYNAAIYTADSGTIPPYTPPGVTLRDVNPPRNLIALEYLYNDDGVNRQGVALSWEHADNVLPDGYEVQILRPNASTWESAGITTEPRLSIHNTPVGYYSFRVRTKLGLLGSVWVTLTDEYLSLAEEAMPDVTGLQATYRNGKMILSWDDVIDPHGRTVEYIIRYGSDYDGGTTVGVQNYTEYVVNKDGSYWIKAHAVDMVAVSATATGVVVDGVNQAVNVVESVETDWGNGVLTGSCYRPPDYLSRRWIGAEETALPDSDVWLVDSGFTYDATKKAIKAPSGSSTTYVMRTGIQLVGKSLLSLDFDFNFATNNDDSNIHPYLYYVDANGKSKYLDFEIFTLSGRIFLESPSITYTSSKLTVNVRINLSDNSYTVTMDSISISGTTSSYYQHLRYNCLQMGVLPYQNDTYIYEIQCGNSESGPQNYINGWSGIYPSYANSYPSTPNTPATDGYFYPDDEVDIGHDDWVIASVTDLIFHGQDSTVNLLTVADLLAETDLFYGASSKMTVTPQIAVKPDGGSYGDYVNFVNGSYYGRYFKTRLVVTCQEYITAYINVFNWSVDMEDRTEQGDNVTVASGGSTITYTTPFQVAQHPVVTMVGASSGDTLILSNETTTGFDVKILDSSGSDKAGVINYLTKGY